MTAAVEQTLRRAAELIGQQGYTKGTLQDKDGALCLEGAVILASYQYQCCQAPWMVEFAVLGEEARTAYRKAWNAVNKEQRNHITWNDDPAITAEDVILLLKKAAETAEAEGDA